MKPLATILALWLSAWPVAASESGHFNLDHGAALKGYDPVSYHDPRGPEMGSGQVMTTHDGVMYAFVSDANRQRFLADPESFVPRYGGWCATAMAEGEKVDIDPENFVVTDGRLYLFYKGWRGDARKPWLRNPDPLRERADAHWRRIIGAPQP